MRLLPNALRFAADNAGLDHLSSFTQQPTYCELLRNDGGFSPIRKCRLDMWGGI